MLAPRAALAAISGLAVGAWLIFGLGVDGSTALRAFLVLALGLLPWGALLARALPRELLSRAERAVLIALLGYPAAAALYYALSQRGAAWLFLPASAVAAVVAAALEARRPGAPAELPASQLPHWSAALFVPLAVAVATRWSPAFEAVPDGLRYAHSVDHSLHLAFYWELLRGVPAAELPTAAGIAFPSYHFLAFMPGLLAVQAAGVPVSDAYHVLSPVLKVLLLLGATYLAVRLSTGDGRAATAALPVFFVIGQAFEARFADRFVVGPAPQYDFLRNEAEGGGLVVWASVAALLALFERARGAGRSASGVLLLAGLLAGASIAFKAQLFLLFGAAFVVALLLAERSGRALLCLALMALASGALLWAGRRPDTPATLLEWRPGLFAELYVFPNLRRDPWPPVRALGAALESLPATFGALAATLLAWLRICWFSPLVAAFLVHALRRPRALGVSGAFAAAALLLAVPMGFGLSLLFLHRATSPFEFRQTAHGLSLLAAVVSVVALHRAFRGSGSDAGARVLAFAAVACVAAAPTLLREERFVPARASIVLPPDEQCALLFLRGGTRPDAVVLGSRAEMARVNHHAVVAGFAGRRSVLEFYEGSEVDPGHERERDIRRFFSTGDAVLAERILRRYAVDYVLESDALPLSSTPSGLERVFESGRFRVWRVGRAPDAAAPDRLPEVFTRPEALRCPAPR